MKIFFRFGFLLFFVVFIATSCGERSQKANKPNNLSEPDMVNRYASGFRILHFDNYTKVVLNNPWDTNGGPYAVYYLYKNDSISLPDDGFKLKIPLNSIIVNTFSYFEFLSKIDEIDKITGVTDAHRIYNPYILNKLREKKVTDLGDPFRPDLERTLAQKANAVIVSAYAQQDTYNERLLNAGIPIIYSLEWMENSPLARAEWIKMIAAFFDKEALADSIFNEIELRYKAVKEKVADIPQKHTVMAGDNFQGTWYVPGGNSFNAILFRDAKLDYYHKNNKESGSIGLDIESVLTQFGETEYWFGCQADSYRELETKDRKYMLFRSVKNKKVFNIRNRTTVSGGNDYFESATANPDLVLEDLIKAAHPHLFRDTTFTYIKPLE